MYKVLLVEDEAGIRAGLKKLIEETVTGFKVVAEASTGKQALEYLQHSTVNLVVTDIRMSEMGGLDMIQRIREHDARLPILIISGHSLFEYAKQAMRYGVSDYLLKPVNRIELGRFLEQLKRQWDASSVGLKAESDDKPGRRITRIKELIQQRLDQDISLQVIAQEVHLNPKYLSDLFKIETGQHFSDYVTEARMERARQLLRNTHLKIYEIAKMCGYAGAKHFAVAFKHHTGVSPSDFREFPP